PLLCARTEKQHFRYERMKSILVSAMLQSQQSWITELSEPVTFDKFLSSINTTNAFIAHCEEGEKKSLFELHDAASKLVLIGPEGDFSPDEIEAATGTGCQPVTLGNTRLRTETAGIVAATLLQAAYFKR
ncbi:MAG: RsmE family RNA methyltransferase, partial [Chitinophagaceae bacterium]